MELLDWNIDRKSHVPLYLQIASLIKDKIEAGEWTAGSRLPSERLLAAELGVNRSTVTAAYAELTAEGLTEGRRGGGTTVVNNTWTLLAATSPPDWNKYVRGGIHSPNLPVIQEINKAEFVSGIIRLGTGELGREFYPAALMRTAMDKVARELDSLGYEEPKGNAELRLQISRHLGKLGITVTPESLLIVSGSLQALQLVSIGLLDRGSTILVEKPSYLYSVNVFQSAGMQLTGLQIDKGDGNFLYKLEALQASKKGSLLYTIPSFHNPSGRVMSMDDRKALLKISERHALPIIEDDAYRELWLDAPPPPALKALDKSGSVVYTGTLSKTLSPGLRIGWIAGPEPVINRLADIKMQTDYGASSISQRIATEWLASGLYEEHVSQLRTKLKEKRDFVLSLLEKEYADIAEWNVPSGGFYIWLEIKKDLSLNTLFGKVRQSGILINTGNIYDREDRRHLRISYAFESNERLAQGLMTLAEIIRRLP
ncbi:PLP-dependent aminotransferase family protein [Aneurinibacillus sp. Ricciae_BoGa-3]|uniref:aminotransferase-like domain-containing protein n=1 Tax=Aneurinibacillus sp. Ricciae_BoGa-3 TaxID=3022697 RepID=UPI002341A734|nr:PLP-dependent aminotransferase family protein [Aneurinibacillus sp. Ricciae_BoGa-3]WCK53726.1 PLP-dependent aminotransferase family protein [Aneurinibacillus sp. Ricciae_BoGa-3]